MKRLLAMGLGFCLCLPGMAAFADDDDVVESGGSYDYDTDTYSSYTEYENGNATYKEENGSGVTTRMYDAEEDSWHTVYEDANGNMTVVDEKDGNTDVSYYPTDSFTNSDPAPYADEYGTYTPAHPTVGDPTVRYDQYGPYTPAHPTDADYPYYPYSPGTIDTNPRVDYASGTAWVRTNGGRLNLRAYPSMGADVLRRLENGVQVTVTGYSGEWTQVLYGGTRGYVLSRYLSQRYTPAPTPVPYYEKTATEQYATMYSISPRTVTVHPARVGGFVNLRWAPSTKEPVIRYCYEGYTLTAIAANAEWLQVMDPMTNQVGFMMRAYVSGI